MIRPCIALALMALEHRPMRDLLATAFLLGAFVMLLWRMSRD